MTKAVRKRTYCKGKGKDAQQMCEAGNLHQQSQKQDVNTESSPERKVKMCLSVETQASMQILL